MSILVEIFEYKREQVRSQQARVPLAQVRRAALQTSPAPKLIPALEAAQARRGSPALIAEIKRRSPSRGRMATIPDPVELATLYHHNGAAAISVLTDEKYFGGSLENLRGVAHSLPEVPILRKDFICNPYQVYEARSAGAAAVLLIAAALNEVELIQLHSLAIELELTPLVEVHSIEELERAMACEPRLIGINNRDLSDFSVRLETTLEIRPRIPSGVRVVAESGIHTIEDVARLAACGIDAILVGEALVTAADIGMKTRELSSVISAMATGQK